MGTMTGSSPGTLMSPASHQWGYKRPQSRAHTAVHRTVNKSIALTGLAQQYQVMTSLTQQYLQRATVCGTRVLNVPSIWEPPQNSTCQKGDMQQELYCGHWNIYSHLTPAIYALMYLDMTAQDATTNLDTKSQFLGWYSYSSWGQLPVATSLPAPLPPLPPPRSNPTDRPRNLWPRPLLGRRPTWSTWSTSKLERPVVRKRQ